MSPGNGRAADKRSDISPCGGVVFEMLTGRRAFEADDVSETIAVVLRGDADLSSLPPPPPEPVRRLVRRCLTKDTKRRLADIGDARLELEDTSDGPSVQRLAARASAGRNGAWFAGGAVMTLAVLGGIAVSWNGTRAMAPTTPTRFPGADSRALRGVDFRKPSFTFV